jgi:hypothetical protein
MNCISGSISLICLFACTACGAPASETNGSKASSRYNVHYTITPDPGNGSVAVEMVVQQERGQLRALSFALPDSRTSGFEADGELIVEQDSVRWLPDRDGGSLRWTTRVSHQRRSGGYDAWLDNHWGIFRAEDIIPRARTRTLKGAQSETSMTFELPTSWSAVSEYSTLSSQIEISNADRRFDQPRGWIAMGNLGIRRETIAGTRIAIAAPEGQDVRRLDMLALLNWILPELSEVLPESIPRLTIVSAGDPMWRGGLSAPGSIFIHATRPLISENATSTLVHELVHVAMGITAESGFDWIVEGLAEYYSLELLHRGGAITARRFQRALEKQSEWAASATSLCGHRSSGATTALAVITFRNLDKEIREKSAGQFSLDNLLAQLASTRSHITLETIEAVVTELLQGPSDTLVVDKLPGCQQNAPTPEA